MIDPLNVEELYKHCDTSIFDFKTTSELKELDEILGQSRALKAITFGVGIKHEGYNLYVMGDSGSGRHTTVTRFLENKAKNEPAAKDLCYVYNFKDPEKPIAIELTNGLATELKDDMENLIKALQVTIPAIFKTDEYRAKKQQIDDELKQKQENAYFKITEEAKKDSINIKYTATGYSISPMKDDKILTPEEYQAVSDEGKKDIKKKIKKYKNEIEKVSAQVTTWSKEAVESVKELDKDMTKKAVEEKIDALKSKYKEFKKVIDYLGAVRKDIIDNSIDFRPEAENPTVHFLDSIMPKAYKSQPSFEVYNVNVIVSHKDETSSPVIYEDNPTFANLFGQIEYVSQMGTLITDFNLIKPGALHKANGGYLILDTRKLLLQPFVWEGLKRMLISKELKIETLAEELGIANTVMLEPERIKLDIKIVLVGERLLYYLLYNYDPEFQKLFKINADFEDEIERNDDNTMLYANLIAMIAKENNLLPLDSKAVAKVIEYSSRLSGNAYKLTTHISTIIDLLQEADFIAKEKSQNVIEKEDIVFAILEKIERSDRVKDKLYEQIEEGTIFIETNGSKIGQVNGISIIDMGDFSFGEPVKITALTRIGKGEVVDIEREVDLGGPIHSKGVMILSSYLASKYAKDMPLSFRATLSFEQSYAGIEGDSASAAELFTILSSLSDLPIDQSFAITGSVNQNGQIQPVGAINEKIEGFFDVCKLTDSKNKHAVIIPKANAKHLMLKEEVVKAVKNKEFAIYAIENVDEGLELLIGKKSGKMNSDGTFEKDSINYLIQKKLKMLTQKSKQKTYK